MLNFSPFLLDVDLHIWFALGGNHFFNFFIVAKYWVLPYTVHIQHVYTGAGLYRVHIILKCLIYRFQVRTFHNYYFFLFLLRGYIN
jgi:hypothetical protein